MVKMEGRRYSQAQLSISDLKQSNKELENGNDRLTRELQGLKRRNVELETRLANLKTSSAKRETDLSNSLKTAQEELTKSKRHQQMTTFELKKKEGLLQEYKEVQNVISPKVASNYKNEFKLNRIVGKPDESKPEFLKALYEYAQNQSKDRENEDKTALLAYQTTMDKVVRMLSELNIPSLPQLTWHEPNHMKFTASFLQDKLEIFCKNFKVLCDAIVEGIKQPVQETKPPVVVAGPPGERNNTKAFRTIAGLQS